ncbi:DEAD-box ATP-dependent RNA helicase 32 [Forsythia ovata]|uniref:ATP-dependent RNA helicase n=1 Tax=Forsythia ovata TaxID=205694 RepID=A0ABD1Q9V7_9LAMI
MLWSFVKAHLNSRILVFLSSCKQVKFVFEVFKKLRPGIPLRCVHGRMNQERRMGICSQFSEKVSVLFATDVASRGLDFKSVDWVVQVDCPEDVDAYIHRVGRTARYLSGGRSVLFLTPSETKMLAKLQEKKIPIRSNKGKILQTVSGLLSALLVKYPNLLSLAQRAFITYLKSIHFHKDKEVFDVTKLPVDEFAASLGLPMTPKIRFLKQKVKGKSLSKEPSLVPESTADKNLFELPRESQGTGTVEEVEEEKDFLLEKDSLLVGDGKSTDVEDAVPATRVLKKKKLKINVHRPVGTRVVFDEEGNTLPPLAKLSDLKSSIDSIRLDKEKVNQRYAELREEMKMVDKEDKALDRQRRKEKRMKEKLKRKRGKDEEDDAVGSEDDLSGSDREANTSRAHKKGKIYFGSDSDDGESKKNKDTSGGVNADTVTLAEQEALALKLLNSMHP